MIIELKQISIKELTKDYHEQSSLNGFRFSFAVVGTILGAAIVLPIIGFFANESKGFSWFEVWF